MPGELDTHGRGIGSPRRLVCACLARRSAAVVMVCTYIHMHCSTQILDWRRSRLDLVFPSLASRTYAFQLRQRNVMQNHIPILRPHCLAVSQCDRQMFLHMRSPHYKTCIETASIRSFTLIRSPSSRLSLTLDRTCLQSRSIVPCLLHLVCCDQTPRSRRCH